MEWSGDEHVIGQESIIDAGLLDSAIGTDDGVGMDPYNNAVVYFFAFLTVLGFGVFAPVAIGVATYRIAKHRSHAARGLVIALVATAVGGAMLTAVFLSS